MIAMRCSVPRHLAGLGSSGRSLAQEQRRARSCPRRGCGRVGEGTGLTLAGPACALSPEGRVSRRLRVRLRVCVPAAGEHRSIGDGCARTGGDVRRKAAWLRGQRRRRRGGGRRRHEAVLRRHASRCLWRVRGGFGGALGVCTQAVARRSVTKWASVFPPEALRARLTTTHRGACARCLLFVQPVVVCEHARDRARHCHR
jgi:hypothetical protein